MAFGPWIDSGLVCANGRVHNRYLSAASMRLVAGCIAVGIAIGVSVGAALWCGSDI